MRKIMFMAGALVLAVVLLGALQPAPAAAAGPAYYIVRPGDTLFSIAYRHGMSTWAIANANRLWNPNYIYVGQVLVIPYNPYPVPHPVPQPVPYPVCGVRVNYGDTLTAIAARLRTDAWTIARLNGIYNMNWIYAGQWLRVPNCQPGPVPPPVPTVRRNISGNWSSGGSMFQLAEAIGCPGPSCGVAGTYIPNFGGAAVQVSGTVNVQTGAVSITIPGTMPGAPPSYFNGVISADSRTMTGQLTGVGAITFTKQ
ncbi:MAG: LysM peptidoglycan-binding domain-containing protein [Chloroflexi bacterium]|nr:LysM peptidoglycan-binding domain-containing protein [Chloroflexota bacterium]